MKDRQLILKSPEGQFVEFKQSINSTLAREIVGFANTGGGTIVIGVDDNGIIKGMRNINKDVSKIESITRNCDPPISILINLEQKMGKDLLFIDIPDSPEKPHSCSDGFFLRSGATTLKMTRNEIIHFLHSTNQILWDKKKCFSFKYPEDFDNDAFRRFCVMSGMSNIEIDTEDLLITLEVAERSDKRLIFNNAGVLFFAKEPARFHLDAVVDCILFQGHDKATILDRKTQTSNLMENVEQAMIFLKKHLSLRYEIKTLVRKEILELPEDALREAVLNAVIHRDYHFNGANVSVEIYRDRVEISDPGELPPGMKPEDMGKKSVRRNKLLADLFHRIGEVEKVGSGILRMKQALKEAGIQPMRFEFTGFFTIIFNRITEADREESVKTSVKTSVKILDLMKSNPEISGKRISDILGISVRAVEMQISNLQQQGRIKRIGPAKGGHWEVTEGD